MARRSRDPMHLGRRTDECVRPYVCFLKSDGRDTLGVTAGDPSRYNALVKLIDCDAAHQFQSATSSCAICRVLAALPGVSAAVSGEFAIAVASQPVR